MTAHVTFEPNEHVYTLHETGKPDRTLPSVTQIIQDNNLGFDFSQLPDLDLAWYGDRGTKVHLACEYLDKGILDWESVDQRIFGYVESYQRGKDEWGFEVLENENLVWDKLHRYAGTLDRIVKFPKMGRFKGVTAQMDIKSGASHISHGYQTAGYNICLDRDNRYSRNIPRYGIYLNADGKPPKLKAYPSIDDFTIFESAINLYYARRIAE